MLYRDFTVQIVAVNNSRKRATVKLIPRIDLQAMTEKFVTNHLTDLYLFFLSSLLSEVFCTSGAFI